MNAESVVMGPREWRLLLLLALLWGCTFVFIELSLETIPAMTTALIRATLAGILLAALAFSQGHRIDFNPRQLREFLLLGVLRIAAPFALITWAQTRIDSGVAGILNSTSVIFTILVAHAMTRDDRITWPKAIGVALAIAGVAVIMGPEALRGLGEDFPGQLAMLGATCCYGFAAVFGRRFKGTPHVVAASGMLLVGAVLLLPLAVLVDWPLTVLPSARSVFGVVALSVLSSAVAFVVWFRLIQSAGPSNTSMVTLLIPVVALSLGALVLNETPHPATLVGFALIGAGLWTTQRRRSES